ncbi:MAG TPA: SRPBCC family protein [Candidatus Acidoferrum sp.]|nr:SRPBCC family protein [Candidatus Acidoferrum sp.]
MLKIVAIVAVIIVALVAGLLAYAATKPGSLRVQRTASIKAAPEKIFTLINDFRSWGIWSPYEKKDPAMQRTLSGAASGQGAIYAWSGNGNVGQGRMEILESSPPSRIAIKLDFIKPFEGHNLAEFTFEPDGKVTRVTWAMTGPTPFIGKVMSVFLDMDAMIGRDFEAGLANLKAATEQ